MVQGGSCELVYSRHGLLVLSGWLCRLNVQSTFASRLVQPRASPTQVFPACRHSSWSRSSGDQDGLACPLVSFDCASHGFGVAPEKSTALSALTSRRAAPRLDCDNCAC